MTGFLVQQLVNALLQHRLGQVVESSLQPEVLTAGQVVVDADLLRRVADAPADRVGVALGVEAEDTRRAGRPLQQQGEVAGPVGRFRHWGFFGGEPGASEQAHARDEIDPLGVLLFQRLPVTDLPSARPSVGSSFRWAKGAPL